jgi:parvulin-like peptidyl-prolyl isomerase
VSVEEKASPDLRLTLFQTLSEMERSIMKDYNYSSEVKVGMCMKKTAIVTAACMVFFLTTVLPAASRAAEWGNKAPQAERNEGIAAPAGKEVVAKVNGVAITAAALQARVSRVLKARGHGGAGAGQEDYNAIVRKALDKLIVQELAYQRATAEGLKVTPKELDAAIAALKERAGGEEQYRQMLEKNNVTEGTLRKELERNRLVKRIFEKDVLSKVVISEGDIKKEYEKTKNDFVIPEKVLVDDVVLFMDTANKDSLKAAEALREKINKDKDKDPRHIPSDGTFIVREMELHKNKQKDLYEAAVKMREGEVSGVIKTADSFHIIKLKKYQPARDAGFDQVKGYVESRLRAREAGKIMTEWEENLKKGARIEILIAGRPDKEKK